MPCSRPSDHFFSRKDDQMTKTGKTTEQQIELTPQQRNRLLAYSQRMAAIDAERSGYLLAILEAHGAAPEAFKGLTEDGTAIVLHPADQVPGRAAGEGD